MAVRHLDVTSKPFSLPFRSTAPKGAQVSDQALSHSAKALGVPFFNKDLPNLPLHSAKKSHLNQWLQDGYLVYRPMGGVTLILSCRPENYIFQRDKLAALYGQTALALAPRPLIEAALRNRYGKALAQEAEEMVPADQSARGWGGQNYRMSWALILLLLGAMIMAHPLNALLALTLFAVFCQLASMGLKLASIIASQRQLAPRPKPPLIPFLPKFSVLVPLFKEENVATRLAKRLEKIDYPKDLLQIMLIVEEEDSTTQQALAASALPYWYDVIIAPKGQVQTKPRALNYALKQAKGSLIGIYDAEDSPEPDQLQKVVRHFYSSDSDLACVQGRLDYYNPHSNWMSRCFTLEYATWFRLMLKGVERLGLAVPLGGTTLFFRKEILLKIGGWDAHNVTEDADLGIRLYRHGYRTEMLDSTTYEEANCRPIAWVNQRSRWVKGYMVTWMVHMASPRKLWRDLGAKRFFALQIQFLLPSLQLLLAPLMWSFLALSFGLIHPLQDYLTPLVSMGLVGLFLGSAALDLTATLIGLRQSGHKIHKAWSLALYVYFPLATLAAYKAFYELCLRPYYWHKTKHGLHGISVSSALQHLPEDASQRRG